MQFDLYTCQINENSVWFFGDLTILIFKEGNTIARYTTSHKEKTMINCPMNKIELF